MKTTKLLSALLFSLMFLAFTGFTSRAGGPAMAPAENIQKMIKESLKYPAEAVRMGCTGTVDVIFTLSDDGKINIVKTLSECPEITKIVKEQLSTVCCKEIRVPFNTYYKITITYKLI